MTRFLLAFLLSLSLSLIFTASASAKCSRSEDGRRCSILPWSTDYDCWEPAGPLYCCANTTECDQFKVSPFRDRALWTEVDCNDPFGGQSGVVFWVEDEATGICYATTPANPLSPQQLLNLGAQMGGDVGKMIDCDTISDAQAKTACNNCAARGITWVWTAIGCLHAGNPVVGGIAGLGGTSLIGQVLGWAVIVGAGIAFLLIAFAGFQITTAAGDAKRVQAARELLTSAVFGLLLIVFSIFLLNLIGFRVLNLGALGLPPPNP